MAKVMNAVRMIGTNPESCIFEFVKSLFLSGLGIAPNKQTLPTKIERSDTMSSKKVMIGAVVGVAAGAVLGLLFAPAKGSMMRQRMARKVTESAEDVQESLSEYVDAAAEEYGSIKQGAVEFVDKAKKKAATATEKLRAR